MTSILLVDDDTQIVRAIVPALQVSGLTVKVTTNGQDAINQVDASEWDALIVDLGLPDMDGKSVIRHLRTKFTTPVVVISAQHSAAEVDAAKLVGASCFLHKPFRTPDLVQCLSRLLPN
ncbi:response regulator [Sphingomonas sp. BN140010]|uniref:Response regulator n=1 Tax=Sphingomonas arvum TaxID=2992113 RepID=A0ABT3JEY0_9SPHN|nr:response regulator [Sphingomonas sp. BN140010]MCW3797622.1 response regulator [Sphingomonas sp. BN140010]